MKMKARIIIAAVAALFLTGCGNNKGPVALDITGQWELIGLETKSIQIGDQTIEVYMDLKADNTFELWQKLGEGRHRKYSGTWALTETTLTGKYSDGKEWGSAYEVSLNEGNLIMTETKTGTETYTYKTCVIPSGL